MIPPEIPAWLGDDIAAAGICGLWVTRDSVARMPGFRGAYVLAVRLDVPVRTGLLRGRSTRLAPGWYLYLGSAWGSGGVRARISRHFRNHSAGHWHIDWLTAAAADLAALTVAEGDECDLAARLLGSARFTVAAPGFGSTDCHRCKSHLLGAAGLNG